MRLKFVQQMNFVALSVAPETKQGSDGNMGQFNTAGGKHWL